MSSVVWCSSLHPQPSVCLHCCVFLLWPEQHTVVITKSGLTSCVPPPCAPLGTAQTDFQLHYQALHSPSWQSLYLLGLCVSRWGAGALRASASSSPSSAPQVTLWPSQLQPVLDWPRNKCFILDWVFCHELIELGGSFFLVYFDPNKTSI